MKYDFGGYVANYNKVWRDLKTKFNKDAFKDCDGQTVPLVFYINEPNFVIGTVLLENHEDGVYGYGIFNDTEVGQFVKAIYRPLNLTGLGVYINNIIVTKNKKNNPKINQIEYGTIRYISLCERYKANDPCGFIEAYSIEKESENGD